MNLRTLFEKSSLGFTERCLLFLASNGVERRPQRHWHGLGSTGLALGTFTIRPHICSEWGKVRPEHG